MAVVAFLLNRRLPTGYLQDGDLSARIVRTLIAEAKHGQPVRAAVRSGSVVIQRFTYRITEVKEVKGRFGGISRTETPNHPALTYLIADFADARRDSWHAGDTHSIDEVLGTAGLAAFSIGPVSIKTAEKVHQALLGANGYLGAMEVDLGHFVLFKILWSGLTRRYEVLGAKLAFVDDGFADEDRWPLEGREDEDAWWSAVGATSLYWASYFDENREHPENQRPLPDSPRVARTRSVLRQLMTPTTMERIVAALAADPAKLPADSRSFSAEPIPGADDVVISEIKLRNYVLSFENKDGKHKARLFRDLLGIEADDWQYLAEQLRRGVRRAPVLYETRSDQYGVRFHVIITFRGRNGAVKPALSAWIVRSHEAPSLVTAYVADGKEDLELAAEDIPILPPLSWRDWPLLWQVATAAANEAAELTVPNPIYVAGNSGRGEWSSAGAYGMAAVRVLDARTGFSRWLRNQGYGSAGRMSGTWVPSPFRGYDAAFEWAQTFARVLQWHGVECEIFAMEL